MSKFGFDVAQVKLSLVTGDTPTLHPELTDTPLDHALRYADLGWYVIPVRVDKIPLDGYGLNSATKDPAVIRKIWGANPAAGIAIACEKSGLVVLDIDPRNGGHESLARLEAEHGMIHAAAVSLTQGGGEHRVFRSEPGVNYPGTIGAGLDVKYRGYILVEPSRGVDGTYRWQSGKNPIQGQLPQAAHPALKGAPRDYSVDVARIAPGSQVVAPQVYADLRAALNAIPPDLSYTDGWFKVLQGLSRLSDTGAAYEMAREWSLLSGKPGHTLSAFNDKWHSCMREHFDVNYQTVFYLADEHDPERSWRAASAATPALERVGLPPITLDELRDAQLHPRIILPYMLYADVRTRISAGGVGKTTIAIFEAVTLALGRPLWGNTPDRPMRTVMVTREDTREILAARMREIMKALQLELPQVEQVLHNVNVLDLSAVSFRISEVHNDVVQPHAKCLAWLIKMLRDFKPDWLIMDPMVSFGVGEQRVNDAEQGLIEAMRILKKEFDCCVEGIHHSGKANAREKTLDQYSGRGGSALSDGSRMVCVMQPLTAQEWTDATGTYLEESESGIVMAMPKMSYCRPQGSVYVKRSGYSFEHVLPLVAPSLTETQAQHDDTVLGAIKEAWFRNQPLTVQGIKEDYKALFYNNLKRDAVMDAVGRLKRDGRIIQQDTRGGRGNRSALEPIIVKQEDLSKYAISE